MADTERISTTSDQAEDSKDATLPLTPVSDGDGFKHGDHEAHVDAPNGTPTPAEPLENTGGGEKMSEAEDLSKDVEEPPSEPAPVVPPSPMKPKSAVSLDARARKTSMMGKPDPKAAAASLRKTSLAKSTPAAPTTVAKKSPLVASTSATPRVAGSAAATTAAPNRRISVVPTPGHGSRPSISSATAKPLASSTTRPLAAGATAPKTTRVVSGGTKPAAPPVRNSTISPTATATRPTLAERRARPSETGPGLGAAAKRVGTIRTPVVRGATPTQSKAGSPAAKQDEGQIAKHQETVEELAQKTERVIALEEQLSSLQTELKQRQTDVTEHESSITDLRAASESASATRDALEAELASLKESSGLAQTEKEKIQTLLEDTKGQLAETTTKLQGAESSHLDLTSRVSELESTITELREANDEAKLEIDAFKEHASTQGDAEASAAIEREALLKAHIDLEALSASHSVAAEQSALQIKELEAKVSSAEAGLAQLQSEITTLQSERDELKSRISELEVEVLETREANEVDADAHAKEIAKIKDAHAGELADAEARLQDEIKKAALAHEEAMKKWEETTTAAGKEHSASLEAALKSAQESAALVSKEALAALEESHAKTVEDIKARSAQELLDTKDAHERNTTLIAEEMSRLQTELSSQEDKYAAKVREVKAEHDKLVDEAYQRAKAEADAHHSKELNDLRTRSGAMVEEIRSGHQSELNNLNTAHEEALAAQVRSLEKKINSLTVDSNAARDDLAKAKGSVSTQAAELKALRGQLASTKQALDRALATPPTIAPSAELDALKNELRNAKDDFETLKEVHSSSQENFAAMMNNHKLELEEAAKGRVQALAAAELKHEAEKSRHAEELTTLRRIMEEERDAKDRAMSSLRSQTRTPTRTPPVTPRYSRDGANGTSRDELERLHHAHTAKLSQLENEHKQALAQLTINLMEAKDEKELACEELERKIMEMSFQEGELADTQDEVKQLQDEVERLTALVQH